MTAICAFLPSRRRTSRSAVAQRRLRFFRLFIEGREPQRGSAHVADLSPGSGEATKEAQRAGIEHAKARDDAYSGRKPSFTREQLDQVRDMLTIGRSISTIAKTTGLSRQAIYRLKDDPAWAEGVLVTWAA
jgi:hypothetical protein